MRSYNPEAEHEAWIKLCAARREVVAELRRIANAGYVLSDELRQLLSYEASSTEELMRFRLMAEVA